MKHLEEVALARGFSRAVLLEDVTLECQSELRAYCLKCPNHGKNWVCPPGSGTLEACREKAAQFRRGLLVQSISDLGPDPEPEIYTTLSMEHNRRVRDLAEAIRPEVRALMPLSTGGCVVCESCTYPEPCRRPDVKMESLSAFGVDVGKLCRSAGLDFAFCQDKLYMTALILLK